MNNQCGSMTIKMSNQIKSKFHLTCYSTPKHVTSLRCPSPPLLRLATYHFRRNVAAVASTVRNTVCKN